MIEVGDKVKLEGQVINVIGKYVRVQVADDYTLTINTGRLTVTERAEPQGEGAVVKLTNLAGTRTVACRTEMYPGTDGVWQVIGSKGAMPWRALLVTYGPDYVRLMEED